MLTDGVVALLLEVPAITDLIAGGTAIQPIPAPVSLADYPCITYQIASDVPGYTLTGTDGLAQTRLVFDCLAQLNPGGYSVARAIALQVKKALSAYKGTLSDGTKVYFTEIVNCQDGFQSDALLSRSSIHVRFTYQE